MRELIEQDAKEKHANLRSEIEGMKYVFSQIFYFIFALACSIDKKTTKTF